MPPSELLCSACGRPITCEQQWSAVHVDGATYHEACWQDFDPDADDYETAEELDD